MKLLPTLFTSELRTRLLGTQSLSGRYFTCLIVEQKAEQSEWIGVTTCHPSVERKHGKFVLPS